MANKLELTWYGKAEPIIVEPRILIENATMSNNFAESDTENMLIHGDNLLALKALEINFAGKIKCIYIDPPYNTGSAFEQYDDNLEHSQWLNLMRPRLQILWRLLATDGSIWISIDDDEQAYLKVLCDEVFGRNNYLATNLWQKRTSPDMRAVISDGHEYVLSYAKNREVFKNVRNKIPLNDSQIKNFKNPDEDPRGPWTSSDFTAQGFRPNQMYKIVTPAGIEYTPPEGRCWKNVEEVYLQQVRDGRMWFGKDGRGIPRRKTYLYEREGVVPWTWWTNKEVGHNQEAKKEVIALFGAANAFDTPKPERLLQRIIHIATNQNDLVLDSFLGSGTTAAVAHKMGRRWIGIEMGEHAYTHCKVRLDKVVAGKDKGGITKSVSWKGGGGYRFFELAPTLINTDSFGEPVINTEYSAEMLAAAVALHEGFEYQPDNDLFWKQSVGNEKSFLFVTTRHMNSTYLDSIKDTMEENEYLIIACRSFDAGLESAYKHISLKKIPQMLLDRCEFGRTDYNLNIIHPPVYEDDMEVECNE
ncbi:MAG: site-specific DNA-methyltransferase [Firmicutes bacterium HGW-Firmicutes-15]|jgi:adenine-specific DNA-methyltransferase|nr:MAG: site-specific DNA-methyltransferase [Spirochaetae bacterium HGW-Spirochaetae-2]PKM75850.1 MAG: site-specific DNA-methyltransferase [Firmicutes bacterium HGW-Firmicutes-15]